MQSLSKTLRAVFLGVALISLMVACVGYGLLVELRRPGGNGTSPVAFVVDEGDSTSAIATKLADAKLIRLPLMFTILVRSQGLDGSLKAGTYALQPDMTMSQIISALQLSPDYKETSVTIIEGMRLEEIAEVIGSAGLANVDTQTFIDMAREGANFKDQHFYLKDLPDGASLEGYLFPDTYRLRQTATVTDVIDIMLSNFDEKYAAFETEVRVQRNIHEIVTMASIVQRESGNTEEMAKISAALWNRLKPEYAGETGNGRLQSDPTLQYARGTPGNWWPNINSLSLDEINNDPSPYNTRVQPGLPPGPISNPGAAALEAAAKPDESQRYFYFVASCTAPGTHNFATTFEEFQRLEQEAQSCLQSN